MIATICFLRGDLGSDCVERESTRERVERESNSRAAAIAIDLWCRRLKVWMGSTLAATNPWLFSGEKRGSAMWGSHVVGGGRHLSADVGVEGP